MEKKVITINYTIDAAVAHHAAKEMAAAIGFDEQEGGEIALVVSELATNQLTHAHGGTILIEALAENTGGIRVEAVDSGPGIPDVERALADGFSTAGGLGLGLGSANRLMDELEIVSEPGQGTHITGIRRLHPRSPRTAASPLDIGVATRPMGGMTVNGDAFVIKQWEGHALVGVIDGLGHGKPANLAAETARQYVETHADLPLGPLFRGAAHACLATRGVVMALARFDWMEPKTGVLQAEAQFSLASLGNIEVRLFGSPEPPFFNLRRGVVGINAPNAPVTRHPWTRECTLVLHSDGLTSHWHLGDFGGFFNGSASEIAQEILTRLAKDTDDATVIVVKASRKDRIQ